MNAHPTQQQTAEPKSGFTLVELLVVITIIGLLVGLAIPAIGKIREKAVISSIRVEVEGINSSIEAYNNKYGDYPPDFMDWGIVTRHYRKAFPNIAPSELALLQRACDFNQANNFNASLPIIAHDPTRMDRAEALVWSLAGFSSDPQFPFTGSGGPLEYVGSGDPTLPGNYQYNATRENALFEFDSGRVSISIPNANAALSTTNRTMSTNDGATGTDLFPTYVSSRDGAYVYFDSRTYAASATPVAGVDSGVPQFNGFVDASAFAQTTTMTAAELQGILGQSVVRPYMSDQPVLKAGTAGYGSWAASLTGWKFANPNSFQVVNSSLDAEFGLTGRKTNAAGEAKAPVYFMYPSGRALEANTQATNPNQLLIANVKGFQESTAFQTADNFQLDNLTNFAKGRLADDVPK